MHLSAVLLWKILQPALTLHLIYFTSNFLMFFSFCRFHVHSITYWMLLSKSCCSPMDVRWWMVLPYLVVLWMPLHIWMLLPNMLVKWPNPLLMLFFFSVFFSSMLWNAFLAHPIAFQPTWCLYPCGKGSLLTSQHHAYISLLTPRLLMFSNFKFSLENHATLSHL